MKSEFANLSDKQMLESVLMSQMMASMANVKRDSETQDDEENAALEGEIMEDEVNPDILR